MRQVKEPRRTEAKYRRDLNELVRALTIDIRTQVIPVLKEFQQEYVADAYAKVLEEVFDRLQNKYVGVEQQAKIVSNQFVNEVNQTNRSKFYGAIEQAVGVNVSNVIQNEGLEDVLTAKIRENVALIKSIPDEYFKKIETIVFEGTTQGDRASSMVSEIVKLNKSTYSRAKLIARDQTAKVNSVLSVKRAENLGIEEFVWRTAGDERVRPDHASKNGKVFRYDDPPKDTGLPGHDIQCRCIAQPIIKV